MIVLMGKSSSGKDRILNELIKKHEYKNLTIIDAAVLKEVSLTLAPVSDDYYLEMQRHKTDKPNADTEVYQMQEAIIPHLAELSKKTGVKLIASNDVHFVEEEHGEAHDRLICLSTGKKVSDENRMHYTKQEWLKSPQEMAAIFPDFPEALSNTLEIADKVETYSIDSGPLMPKFEIPESFGTEEEYRKKFTEEDLFNEFTRDEKGNVVLSKDAAKVLQKSIFCW